MKHDYWAMQERERARRIRQGAKVCRHCGALDCLLSHDEPLPRGQGSWGE